MKHRIEIFSSGCKICQDTIEMIHKLAGSEDEVLVHDMHQEEIATRAFEQGIRRVPAVVIDGRVASCCSFRGVEEYVVRKELS